MANIRTCKCGKTVTHTSHVGQDGRTVWVERADCPRDCADKPRRLATPCGFCGTWNLHSEACKSFRAML